MHDLFFVFCNSSGHLCMKEKVKYLTFFKSNDKNNRYEKYLYLFMAANEPIFDFFFFILSIYRLVNKKNTICRQLSKSERKDQIS
jgi:hypothetical protein